jgi:hypothetical protein
MIVHNVFTQTAQPYSYLYFPSSLIIPKNGVSSWHEPQFKFTLHVTHTVTPLQVHVDERVFLLPRKTNAPMCLFAHKNDILNIFRRVRINREKRLLVSSNLSVCLSVSLSVYLHVSPWLRLDGFIWKFLLRTCIRKSVEKLHILVQ